MELNPTQKDLVLKIAELLCKNDVTDGRAKYWVERAAKLFPGSPAIYKLKVKKKLKKTKQIIKAVGEKLKTQLLLVLGI